MVIGPGSVNFSRRLVWARASRALVACTRPLRPRGTTHGRHHGLVAVLADAHFDPPGKIDAFDMLEKAVDEMLTRLLAVGHDVDSRILLLLDDEQRGIALGRRELRAGKPPRRPELVGLGEPGWVGQAAGDRGGAHRTP